MSIKHTEKELELMQTNFPNLAPNSLAYQTKLQQISAFEEALKGGAGPLW